MDIVIIFFSVFAGLIVLVVSLLVVTLKAKPANKKQPISKQIKKDINELKALVTPLLKDSTKIKVLESTVMPLDSNLKSQFGGLPYFEADEKWPQSVDGKNLEFVLQIFDDNGTIFPDGIKLAQFFCDFEALSWGNEDGYWLVKTYNKIDKKSAQVINKPAEHTEVKYCDIVLEKTKSMPELEDLESIPHISQFLKGLGKQKWGVYSETQTMLTENNDYSSHIGGYANWIQNSEYPSGDDYILLFQICSEDDANIMWGDCGNIYVFYNLKNKKTEFVFQCS